MRSDYPPACRWEAAARRHLRRRCTIAIGRAACATALLLASSQPAVANLLALQDWGVYGARSKGLNAAPAATSGVTESFADETLLLQTTEICASLGTWFGVRFRLSANTGVKLLLLSEEIDHPALPDHRGGRQSVDVLKSWVAAGRSQFGAWVFRDPRALIAGRWTFIFRSLDGQILLQKSFTVETGCATPIA